MANFWFYVGSYTSEGRSGKGISLCSLDRETGHLTHHKDWPELLNPTYLTLDLPRQRLFAVRSCPRSDGPALLLFEFNANSRNLTLLDQATIDGEGPCHVDVNAAGTLVAAANYPSGSVSVFEVSAEGRFGRSRTIQHEGSGPNPKRQEGPHAHCILFVGPSEFLATDLGADAVIRYRCDDGLDNLTAVGQPIRTAPGAGPRHVIQSNDGRFLFVVNELSSTVDVVRDGAVIASASTLPDDFTASNTCAAIHKSGDERFVYASNRGHDSIAIFRWRADGETLEPSGHLATAGTGPRDFSLTPDEEWLVAANQTSNSLVSFKRNHATGDFSEPVDTLTLGAPVCVKFLPS